MNLPVSIALGLAAGVLLSGCSSSACGAVGGRTSSVRFVFGEVRAEHVGERLSVKACVETACQSVKLGRNEVAVLGRAVVDAPLDVTLTISDRAGHVVFDGGATVHPVKEEVNGRGCPPKTWQAGAAATSDGTLRAVTIKPE